MCMTGTTLKQPGDLPPPLTEKNKDDIAVLPLMIYYYQTIKHLIITVTVNSLLFKKYPLFFSLNFFKKAVEAKGQQLHLVWW